MQGAFTAPPLTGVRPKAENLSVFAPDTLPQAIAFFAISLVGMFMTHSFEALISLKLWFRSLITQPTSGGSKSIMVCQDMVMILARPFQAELTMTTGPDSSKVYTLDSGKDFFINAPDNTKGTWDLFPVAFTP